MSVHCPNCRSAEVTYITYWTATSSDDSGNTATLYEYQCEEQGTDHVSDSFWLAEEPAPYGHSRIR